MNFAGWAGRARSVLLCVGLAACDEEVSAPAPKSSARAPAPSASASAEPRASLAPPPEVAIDESQFAESDRSRDPFRSFARSFIQGPEGPKPTQLDVLLPDYTIDELKLVGIVTRMQPAKAMLVDPTGKGHVVHRGQFVGRPDVVQTAGRSGTSYQINWRVDRIREGDVVFVREDPRNPDVPSVTRVIPLRVEGAAEK